jgi:DNA-binding response OmpR family regulator
VPFVVFSGSCGEREIQELFDAGALDYWSWPLATAEIRVKTGFHLSKPKVILRGLETEKFFGYRLCGESLCLFDGQKLVCKFTGKEFQILSLFFHCGNQVISRQLICDTIWRDTEVSSKSIDVHLFKIRKKLVQTNLSIDFVRPSGYRLADLKRESREFVTNNFTATQNQTGL